MWHKEIVELLYPVGVLDTTQVSVIMGRQVVTSAVKRVNSLKSLLRISKGWKSRQ